MELTQRNVLTKTFIKYQFIYCPLICMLHSRTLNNGINNVHDRALRLTYKDKLSSFKSLRKEDYSAKVTISGFEPTTT